MVRRELQSRLLAFGITALLLILIILVFTPTPSTAVYLSPGTPSPTSLTTSSYLTFNNINLTIRGGEAIPVNYLNFSIRSSSDNQEVAYVQFTIQGTELADNPAGRFTVTNLTNTSALPYQTNGTYFGYDERTGENPTYNYGYGTTPTDLTILYRITYHPSSSGTFYGQLYVNSTVNTTTHTYASGSSTPFSVSSGAPPPGGGGGDEVEEDLPIANAGGPYYGLIGTPVQFDGSKSTAPAGQTITTYTWSFGDGTTANGIKPSHTYLVAKTYTIQLTIKDSTNVSASTTTTATINTTIPQGQGLLISTQTLAMIETMFGLTLQEPFYANDTNGDGIMDVFTDPNYLLSPVNIATIQNHTAFLLSTGNDDVPEFFWDTINNTITRITHAPVSLTTPFIDTIAKTVTFEIMVNKTGWIYLDITDRYPPSEYPHYIFTVKVGDRIITQDRIWRMNGKIYILDDPDILYDLIYGYTLLPPTVTPLSGDTLTTLRPSITLTYPDTVYLVTAFLDSTSILYQFITQDHLTFTFTPVTDLTPGLHTLSVTAQDEQGFSTLTSTATYTISVPPQPFEIPWLIVVVLLVIISLIGGTVYYLYSNGYF